MPTPRPMEIDDLLRFEWVADPQISPDGMRVAFTRVAVDATEDDYRTSLWIMSMEGGEPRALTAGPRDSQPRWSPDGTRLAFVRAAEPKKPGQLFVLPMNGGEALALGTLEKGAADPAWSPDGKRLAFTSTTNPALDAKPEEKPKNEPARIVTRPVFRFNGEGFLDPERPSHIWVTDATGGPLRQLTTGRYHEQSPRWSRDGRQVLFISDRRPQPWFGLEHGMLYAVAPELEKPAEEAELSVVVETDGVLSAVCEGANRRFAAIGIPAPEAPRSYDQPRLLFAEGPPPAKARVLAADHDFPFGESLSSDQHAPRGGGATPLALAEEDRAVITVAGRHGAAFLVRVEIASGAVTELTEAGLEVCAGTATADGRRWALTVADPARPAALYAFELATRELRLLWDPNAALMAGIRLGKVEEFWYDSLGGTRIQAWVVTPPDFDPKQKYPLILEIHGGPHVAYGFGFFHEFHQLAAAGYVVLYTNPRGSTTYGQEFGNVIQYRYPGDDHHDLMTGVDVLLKRGFVDEQRMGITGGSGGGLLTNWAITQTDRFKAAITQRCVADWSSMWYGCDFAMYLPYWFRGAPHENPQEFLERSPATYAAKIKTPLMVIHSEEDWRTPTVQGETMFRALKYHRVPTVMVRFPGESHELSRSGAPSRRVQNQQHIRRWFDRWLLNKPAPEYDE